MASKIILLSPKALMVGNSDSIGLAATKRLLKAGWSIVGISRSGSSINDPAYHHRIADVSNDKYPDLLNELVAAIPGSSSGN